MQRLPTAIFMSILTSVVGFAGSPGEKNATDSASRARQLAALKAYALGEIYLRHDEPVQAIVAFQKAVRLDPRATAPLRRLIPLYRASGQTSAAKDACKRILAVSPGDAPVWVHLVELLRPDAEPYVVRETLQQAVRSIDAKQYPLEGHQLYFGLAVLEEEAGHVSAAVNAYRESARLLVDAIHQLPQHRFEHQKLRQKLMMLYERVGQIMLDAGDLDAAGQAYRDAQKANPSAARWWELNLAIIALLQQRYRAAEQHIDRYLQLRPASDVPYRLKVKLLRRSGREAEILPWLEAHAAADRYNTGLKLLLAEQAAYLGHVRKAERVLLDLVKQSPGAETVTVLLKLYLLAPEFGPEHALGYLDSVVGRASRNGDSASFAAAVARGAVAAMEKAPYVARSLIRHAARSRSLKNLDPATVAVLAREGEALKLWSRCERLYTELVRRSSDDQRTAAYAGLLRALWHLRRYDVFVNTASQAVATAPKRMRFLFLTEMARGCAKVGKTDAALAAIDRALGLAPKQAKLDLGVLRIQLLVIAGKANEAIDAASRLLRQFDDPADKERLRFLLASIYSLRKNFSKAEAQLQLILKSNPASARAYNDLGYLWADQGKNLEEAEAMIRKALALDGEQRAIPAALASEPVPDKAAYVDSLGWVLFRRGKLRQALEQLQRAVALPDGNDPVIWEHLGDVCYRLGRFDEARSAWQRALRLYADDALPLRTDRARDVRRRLERLQRQTTLQP